jgi:hypothetical protein
MEVVASYLHVNGGYISNDIILVINNSKRRYALNIHQFERGAKWLIAAAIEAVNRRHKVLGMVTRAYLTEMT